MSLANATYTIDPPSSAHETFKLGLANVSRVSPSPYIKPTTVQQQIGQRARGTLVGVLRSIMLQVQVLVLGLKVFTYNPSLVYCTSVIEGALNRMFRLNTQMFLFQNPQNTLGFSSILQVRNSMLSQDKGSNLNFKNFL